MGSVDGIIYPDADIDAAATAAINGMNFSWCGQSCGSTSRLFVHESVYDAVIDCLLQQIRHFVPGDPTDNATTMGSLISKIQLNKSVELHRDCEIGKCETAVWWSSAIWRRTR
jgi:betaine-aldehyde dehydrogenase